MAAHASLRTLSSGLSRPCEMPRSITSGLWSRTLAHAHSTCTDALRTDDDVLPRDLMQTGMSSGREGTTSSPYWEASSWMNCSHLCPMREFGSEAHLQATAKSRFFSRSSVGRPLLLMTNSLTASRPSRRLLPEDSPSRSASASSKQLFVGVPPFRPTPLTPWRNGSPPPPAYGARVLPSMLSQPRRAALQPPPAHPPKRA
mmetsp:Transcript_52019/g.129542  ORF Transcript_52019/g.129542 Transcript_52019/m.129542 type:complete len:201 (+) Transcript_52019:216-818(+)